MSYALGGRTTGRSATCVEEDTHWKSRYDDLVSFLKKHDNEIPRQVSNLADTTNKAKIFEGRLNNWLSNQALHYKRNDKSQFWEWRVPLLQDLGIDITNGSLGIDGGASKNNRGCRKQAQRKAKKTVAKKNVAPRTSANGDRVYRSKEQWDAIMGRYERAKGKPSFSLRKFATKENVHYNTFFKRLNKLKKQEQGALSAESEEEEEDAEEDVQDEEIVTDEEDGDDDEDDEDYESEKEAEPPKVENIQQYVTVDLWSEQTRVVEKALDAINTLATDSDENLKTIEGLCGHMLVLTTLKKNDQKQKVVHSAVLTLYNLIVAHTSEKLAATMSESLRSAGLMDVMLDILCNGVKNPQTVFCALGLLETMIGNSWDRAIAFCINKVSIELGKTKSSKKEIDGLGLIAHYMKSFPVSCTCGSSVLNNDITPENGGCQKCDQQIHIAALELIKALGQHAEIRHTIVSSECFPEISRCVQHTSTHKSAEKPALYWEAWKVMKILGDGDNNNGADEQHQHQFQHQQRPQHNCVPPSPPDPIPEETKSCMYRYYGGK